MRIQQTVYAMDNESFAPAAFEATIRKSTLTVNVGSEVTEGKLVAADVAEDGRSARLTFVIDKLAPGVRELFERHG